MAVGMEIKENLEACPVAQKLKKQVVRLAMFIHDAK